MTVTMRAFVAEVDLDLAEVLALFQQVGGVASGAGCGCGRAS